MKLSGRWRDDMVLENKLGITNSAELAREEERISKKKAVSTGVCGARPAR